MARPIQVWTIAGRRVSTRVRMFRRAHRSQIPRMAKSTRDTSQPRSFCTALPGGVTAQQVPLSANDVTRRAKKRSAPPLVRLPIICKLSVNVMGNPGRERYHHGIRSPVFFLTEARYRCAHSRHTFGRSSSPLCESILLRVTNQRLTSSVRENRETHISRSTANH